MRIIGAVFLFVFSSLISVAWPAQQAVSVDPSGESILSASNKKISIELKIKTYLIEGNPTPAEDSLLMKDCLDGRPPCSFVEDISISVNKNNIVVPHSVYRGVTNLRRAILSIIGSNKYELKLVGGDASESYILVILFDADGVNRRKLYSALAPQDALEDTYYPPQKETFDK